MLIYYIILILSIINPSMLFLQVFLWVMCQYISNGEKFNGVAPYEN